MPQPFAPGMRTLQLGPPKFSHFHSEQGKCLTERIGPAGRGTQKSSRLCFRMRAKSPQIAGFSATLPLSGRDRAEWLETRIQTQTGGVSSPPATFAGPVRRCGKGGYDLGYHLVRTEAAGRNGLKDAEKSKSRRLQAPATTLICSNSPSPWRRAHGRT